MYVTVREIVRKIIEDGNLLKYLPQCLIIDFIEFSQMHSSRKEFVKYLTTKYSTGLDYRVFKNAVFQQFYKSENIKEAVDHVAQLLNCGLSPFEQTRRTHVAYPLQGEIKNVVPPKSILKFLKKQLHREKRPWGNHPVDEEKGVNVILDGVTGYIDSVIGENSDLLQCTLNPFLGHLLEALILLTMRRRITDSHLKTGLEGRVAIFYPALQYEDNEYVPYFRIASCESYFNKKFTDRLWEDVLVVRNEILALKLQILNEELDTEAEVQEDILETYAGALEKLQAETSQRYIVNDNTLLVFDDEILRQRARNQRDQQQ